jgi:hypothetical protein
MIQTVTYEREGSPYEDWIKRGCPEDVCISYCWHSNETAEYFVLIPHLNIFYAYGHVSMQHGFTAIEAVVKFKVDRGNRTIALTGAVCRTPRMAPVWGGINHFGQAIMYDDSVMYGAMKLFGRRWTYKYGPASFMPRSMMKIGRSYDDQCHPVQTTPWNYVIGHYSTSRRDAAIKIQAAFRGWRVRMQYRYSPYNNLGRHVIMKMME